MSDAATIETPVAPVATPSPRQLVPSRFQNAEHARTVWRVVAEEGTEIEDVLQSIFWAHVGHIMQPFDRIEILADDEAWFLELLVRDCARGFAKVIELHRYDLEPVAKTAAIEGFEIAWKGPRRKWAVIREADRGLLRDGFADKGEALSWAQDHARAGGA